MNYIQSYYKQIKHNKNLVKSLPLDEQSFWLELLTSSDRAENSTERQLRRKVVSLDHTLKNKKNGDETTLQDLFIDDSPNALETLIQEDDEKFISDKLPKLKKILAELDTFDKELILLAFSYEEYEYKYKGTVSIKYRPLSYRAMGRRMNVDYRKIQRRIPFIMEYLKSRLKE
mgnify:CR=1 FL=1